MKKLMILGALVGFSIGTTCGVLQGCSGPAILWRGSIAAVVAGYILRWWGRVWIRALHSAYHQKLAAAAAQETPNPTHR